MIAYFSIRTQVIALAIGIFATVGGINRASADVFTIDTNQSSLTISGDLGGYLFTAQSAGSLTAVYSGTIQASQAAGTIQFTGSSAIAAITNGSWIPMSGGAAGSAPADYGASVSLYSGFESVKAALRLILLDVTSPPISVSGGQFDATALTFGFPLNSTSALDYTESGLQSGSGSLTLTGDATNNVSSTATLATVGNVQTLTIPVNTTFTFSVSSITGHLILTGQIVASESAGPPPLTIGSASVSNQVVRIQWQSGAAQNFVVLSSTNLTSWKTNASNVTSGTASYSYTETNKAPVGFYRLAQ